MKKIILALLGLMVLLAVPRAVQAQSGSGDGYNYIINPDDTNTITITEYTGTNTVVTIPTTINNLLVTSLQNDDGASPIIPGEVASITIPDSVVSIGSNALSGGSLTNITIGKGVTNIGEFAFFLSFDLTAIMVDAQNMYYSSVDGVLFDKSQTRLIQFPLGLGGSYTIPNSVKCIGVDAFDNSGNLTNVTIPNSVTSIGVDAFARCSRFTSITIPASVTSIEEFAFYNCDDLTSAIIGGGVTNMGDGVFIFCYSLTNVTIGSSVTDMGEFAFRYCTSLTNITIPGSVTNIGTNAFSDCSNLTSVYFTGNAPAVGSEVFSNDLVTAYYLPETTGWSNTFAYSPSVPAVLWNPLIQAASISNNQFGFNITNGSITNIPISVETCTNLANPVWTPLTNLILTNSVYFSDPGWTNYPTRFYGLGFP